MLLFSLVHTFNVSWFYRELRRGRIFPSFCPTVCLPLSSVGFLVYLLDNLLMWYQYTSCEAKHQNCIIALLYFAGNCLKYKAGLLLSSKFWTAVLGNRKKNRKENIAPASTSCRLWEGMWKFLLLRVTLLFCYSALPSWQGRGNLKLRFWCWILITCLSEVIYTSVELK